MSQPWEHRTHYLYRQISIAGTLLYIGITHAPFARLAQHERYSPWWRLVADIKWEKFGCRSAAAEAEKSAVVNEKPIFNTTYSEHLDRRPVLLPRGKSKAIPVKMGFGIKAMVDLFAKDAGLSEGEFILNMLEAWKRRCDDGDGAYEWMLGAKIEVGDVPGRHDG